MEKFKEQIETILTKMKNDPSFEANFKADPVTAIEHLMDIDLPNDKIDDIITAVKAKIGLDESGILDKLGQIDAGDVGNVLGKIAGSDNGGMLGKLTGLFK